MQMYPICDGILDSVKKAIYNYILYYCNYIITRYIYITIFSIVYIWSFENIILNKESTLCGLKKTSYDIKCIFLPSTLETELVFLLGNWT